MKEKSPSLLREVDELKALMAISRERDLTDMETDRVIKLMHTEKYTVSAGS